MLQGVKLNKSNGPCTAELCNWVVPKNTAQAKLVSNVVLSKGKLREMKKRRSLDRCFNPLMFDKGSTEVYQRHAENVLATFEGSCASILMEARKKLKQNK
jgi:hypothetical protein